MSIITVEDTTISGVQVLTRIRQTDDRGFLERLFDETQLQPVLAGRKVEQINRTKTLKAGTVRGLHLQLSPAAELKIVSCLRAAVFDVAVDLRSESPTFGMWFGCELTSDNGCALVAEHHRGERTGDHHRHVDYLDASKWTGGLFVHRPDGCRWLMPIWRRGAS